MQYKKDKHMQAYLMGGKKNINVFIIYYVFPRKTQKGNSEVLITQSLVQTGGGGIPTTFQTRSTVLSDKKYCDSTIPSQKNYQNGIV